MENEEFVKVYLSSVEGPNRRARPLGKWEDSERRVRGNGLEWTKRERWKSVCRGHPLGGCFRRDRGVGAIY